MKNKEKTFLPREIERFFSNKCFVVSFLSTSSEKRSCSSKTISFVCSSSLGGGTRTVSKIEKYRLRMSTTVAALEYV